MSVPAYAASDAVSAALGFALDGLSLRQRTIADNIANIDTPDFRASTIDFESALSSAIGSGDTAALRGGDGITSLAVDTPVGANGNNVDLRKETLAAMQSQFQYQMVTRAVTDRFDLVKSVAGAV
ncbi:MULTISPECIES: flagellar basal body rod protein FlgB [Nocardioides]|uniref:Flagellar basal body rod protein FlgB n=1 Tax=Nocardioides lianchengensis TaxID=1045774 RepID=A0A1G6U2F0_9ACTN|nr:flagellar basal body rod protein FlgB [Nocardioides lianchengensis]NYG11554.1 flagellar basal-body rod protein FlgB [Nocardioides lianchengensis]SDD35483.1 flagellar basal-body rod protein FlgB [Nocardioides lianchengensis]